MIAPTTLTAGDGASVVTVTGTGFTRASEVFAQNNALATTFVSATTLRATVPSFLIASAGSLSLVVTTGLPGGGSSTARVLTVKAATSGGSSGSSGSSGGSSTSCAYKCADYNYAPFTCFSNWYCIGSGESAGCLAQIPCTDTPATPAPSSCQYQCTDYNYDPGDCVGGYYCQFSDGCLVPDNTCP